MAGLIQFAQGCLQSCTRLYACGVPAQELYSHYTQQVKDTCASLSDPHKAYLLRKAMHYFNTQRQHRQEAHDKPLIEVGGRIWQTRAPSDSVLHESPVQQSVCHGRLLPAAW